MKWYRLATVLLLTSCRGLKPLPPQLSRLKSSAAKTRGQISMRSQKKGVMVHRDAPLYKPRGEAQRAYVDHLNDPKVNVLLGVGPAGTGKTLFACSTAVQELRSGSVSKIVLTRPVVPVEEDIGHLPGTLNNKMHPWTRPIFDILEEFYSTRDIEDMLRDGIIEISPLAFMRGRTFKRAFVIADEMQNSSPNQMLMLATRLGEGSKLVVTGDLKQSDRCENNGLLDLMNRLDNAQKGYKEIQMVNFGNMDVQRSSVVSKILKLYEDKK